MKKAFKYVKRMLPLLRAMVKFNCLFSFYFILVSSCKDFYLVCKYVLQISCISFFTWSSGKQIFVSEGAPCLKKLKMNEMTMKSMKILTIGFRRISKNWIHFRKGIRNEGMHEVQPQAKLHISDSERKKGK